MDNSHEKTMRIGYGFSTLADSFQAGRDAAQAAKNQMPGVPLDLALAIGPADIHFKDFIEGVRLVTGENTLVGIPAPWVFSSEAPNTRSRAVLLLHADRQKMTVVSSPEERNPLVSITSLMTDLRQRRGNSRLDFGFHGLLSIDNMASTPRRFLAHHLSADAGLESWLAGFAVWPGPAPLMCGPQRISHGITAIECLSDQPWGVGWVDTSSFPAGAGLRREAARASVREAVAQLPDHKPVAGLLLVASDHEPLAEADAMELFRSASAAIPNVPLIGLPVRSPFLRAHGRTISDAHEGIVSLLVPR